VRHDMSKLIVECYREDRSFAVRYRKRRRELRRMDEDSPRNESMRKIYKVWKCETSSGEHLNPLRRYLQSQVGRPWDKVRSEMSEHMDRNSTVQAHIWQHAVDYVETNTFIGEDGEVWHNASKGLSYWNSSERGAVQPISEARALVYVDPRSRCLKAVPERGGKAARAPEYRGIVIDKTHQAHRIRGIWYIITLTPRPAKVSRQHSQYPKNAFTYWRDGTWLTKEYHDVASADIVASNDVPGHWFKTQEEQIYGIVGVYASRKKQCSRKELRQLGLENTKPS
jgi:hypothetical protein